MIINAQRTAAEASTEPRPVTRALGLVAGAGLLVLSVACNGAGNGTSAIASDAGIDATGQPDADGSPSEEAGSSSDASAESGTDGGAESGTDGSTESGADGGEGGADGSADAAPLQGALVISPIAPVITVLTGKPIPTVQFAAAVGGTATSATWALDDPALGSVNGAGLFTPGGTVAGTGKVTATYGALSATTIITVNIQTIDQGDPTYAPNPPAPGPSGYGGVGGDGPGAPPSAGQIAALNGAPIADATVTLLYPYAGTVWPQGLPAPLLQWDPGAHSFDSVYVHIQETGFDYKGYFAANATPFVNVPIPQGAWNTTGFSSAGGPVTISLVFGEGTTAYGPYTETWKIAPGSLQGTISYDSYGTSFVVNSGSLDVYGKPYGAGTVALVPGATSPTLVAGVASASGSGCRVCHTASSNGSTLVTQASNSADTSYATTELLNLLDDSTAGAGTPLARANLAFPALYPDGSLLFSNAAVMNGLASADLIPGDGISTLYALPAGTPVPGVTGLPASFAAGLPAFSPDGKHVSFNFWGGTIGTATGDQVSLGVIDFDGAKTFSNPRVVYTPAGSTPMSDPAVIYSSFLPTSSGIVFEQEISNGGDTSDWGYTWAGWMGVSTPPGHTSELWWLDLGSGTAHRLDQLNGYGTSEALYLPAGTSHTAAQDATVNYLPSVTPIASGGYAWVVFTSRRLYGNVATLPPWTSNPAQYPWQDPGNVTPKKLWIAAIDLSAPPGTDASHPAFYLPGQELHAANSRGYWTASPCKADGSACGGGDECCGGFCRGEGDGGIVCTSQTPICASVYEKCATTADCCGVVEGVTCMNRLCTAPTTN